MNGTGSSKLLRPAAQRYLFLKDNQITTKMQDHRLLKKLQSTDRLDRVWIISHLAF
jgi:hypothetical protein